VAVAVAVPAPGGVRTAGVAVSPAAALLPAAASHPVPGKPGAGVHLLPHRQWPADRKLHRQPADRRQHRPHPQTGQELGKAGSRLPARMLDHARRAAQIARNPARKATRNELKPGRKLRNPMRDTTTIMGTTTMMTTGMAAKSQL